MEAKANVEAVDVTAEKPLHCAVAFGCADTIKILLATKANLEASRNNNRMPPHLAAMNVLLAVKAGLEAVDDNGWTALHHAVAHGDAKIVQILLELKARVEVTDISGRTPLHVAAFCGNVDIISMLIRAKANPEAVDERNMTLLHIAIVEGRENAVRALIKNGANLQSIDRDGNSPLSAAMSSGNAVFVKAVLEGGTQINTVPVYKALLYMIREKEHEKSGCDCAHILSALLIKGLNIQAIKQDVLRVIKSKPRKTAFDCLCIFILLESDSNKKKDLALNGLSRIN